MIDREALRAEILRVIREEQARPEYVNQRNVLAVLGLGPRDYLHHARAGAFPSTKVRRLVVARTADVIAWLDKRITRNALAAKTLNPIDAALARAGAHRVG